MKFSVKSCSAVIPVYNEENGIESTLAKLSQALSNLPLEAFEIICVNDGSSDNTARILESQKFAKVINHKVNRGYGAALKTGIAAAKYDWILIIDADGSYPTENLAQLFLAVHDSVEMVVGAREGSVIASKPLHRLARWILRKMVHFLTGVMVPDLNSGLRIFKKSLFAEFKNLLPQGFSFTTTITVSALYSGKDIEFIKIKYLPRIGASNIKPIRDFLGFSMLIVRLASYFEPLRFFLPLALVVFTAGILRAIRDVLVTQDVRHIGNLAVVLVIASFQVFIMGILADVIVRRSQSSDKN